MRWYVLGVDYEMNGKDLIESYMLSSKINRLIGGNHPLILLMNFFLMKKEKKFQSQLEMEYQ